MRDNHKPIVDTPTFANWRIIPDPEDGRVVVRRLRGDSKPLASLTPQDARQLADVLILAAHQIERAA